MSLASAISDFKAKVLRRSLGGALQQLPSVLDELALVAGSGASSGSIPMVSTVSALASTAVPAMATVVEVRGYAVEGDAPVCRYRIAKASEVTLPGVITGPSGTKWIINETTLIPEWFGAKGDSNGFSSTNPDATKAAGCGNDDAPAFRTMLNIMSALKVSGTTLPGRKYRMGSHTTHRGGQKAVLVPGSNTNLTVRSDVIHDSYDPVSGSVSFFFTDGISTSRVNNIRLKFDGGAFVHPADAVKPRTGANKGSITFYYCDDFELTRVKKTGPSPTNFQVSIFHSSSGIIDGGFIGYPTAPVEVGDDGFHIIGECRDIIARGMIINSGDDPISITCELNMTAKTIERIFISDIICTTPIANLIKIHIVNTEAGDPTNGDKTNNCIIQDVKIQNVYGRLLGALQGAAITINNDDPSKGNIIRRIDIDNFVGDVGTLPKTNATISLQGQAIRIYKADDVNITNSRIVGQHNYQLMFYGCKGGSFDGTLVNSSTNNSSVTLLGTTNVTSAVNSGTYRRVTLAGSPNLTAIKAQVDAANAWVNVNDLKYPILTMTGMGIAGYNGSFVIRAVDTTNFTVDIENFRSGTNDEAAATGTATITSGTLPNIVILQSDDVKIKARVVNPLSWATAVIANRSGIDSNRNEIDLKIEGQMQGYGILTRGSTQARLAAVGRNCKSGSYMIRIEQASGITAPYNHVLNSDDFASLADPLQGWGRTVLSDYASDRFDTVRGRTPTRYVSFVDQASGSTTFEFIVNVAVYGGHSSTNITVAHLAKLIPRSNGVTITGVTWDTTNAKFVVTTTQTTGIVRWDYTVMPPN